MTQTVYWSFPTRIAFGPGSVAQVGREAKVLGGTRALIVADAGVVSARLHEPVIRSLEGAGVVTSLFTDVDPNPVESNVYAGVSAFRAKQADLIVALGGGSPLDVAKLIRLKAFAGVHELPLVEYDDATGGDRHITSRVPPMIAIPTTAGTGSEVGRSGVVTLEANHRKTVIFSPHLLPNVAVLDPELTVSMPPRVTAATGVDALTHCLEAYVSRGEHPLADAIALGGLRLVGRSLRQAVRSPGDLAARGDMMKAAMMGAVAFQKGLGACHSLAHPLSSECGLHHGLANALCLPAVVEFNAPAAGDRLADAASALGVEASATALAAALRALNADLGLPAGLREAGVRDEHLDRLADKAFEDACHGSNPRACTRDDLRALFVASL